MLFRIVFGFCLLTKLSCATAFASEQSEVVQRIQATVDAANKNIDPVSFAANFAPSVLIVDDLAPFTFDGSSAHAIGMWLDAYTADSAKNHVTDFTERLLKPRRVEVHRDRAYVVIPALYGYKQDGKPESERGTITATLVKMNNRWLICSWSWAAD
jgi:hypothetical protein